MGTFEKAYTTKEVSTDLKIGNSTLRKWCLSLEKNGYTFLRNEQNNRLFVEKDLVILQHFKKLVQEVNMPMDAASTLVMDRLSEETFESGTGIVPVEKKEESRELVPSDILDKLNKVDELVEQNKELMEQNQALKTALVEMKQLIMAQHRYLDERMSERDQKLLEFQKHLLETASSKEEKKSWWKFWE